MAATLLEWEGAPDTEFFRSLAWACLHQLPAGAQATAADTDPRLPLSTSPSRPVPWTTTARAGPGREVTAHVLSAGGQIFRYADLVALASPNA